MSQDQINSLTRQALMIGGSALATFFVQRGILSSEQVSFLATQAPALIGIATALGGAVWSIVAHKPANLVAAVAAMPEVSHVVTAATPAGDRLAEAAGAAPGAAVLKSPAAPPTMTA